VAEAPGQQAFRWEDSRRVRFELLRSWGWWLADAAWSAYYGKPFSAELAPASADTAPEQSVTLEL
jgi:hypothetical protein